MHFVTLDAVLPRRPHPAKHRSAMSRQCDVNRLSFHSIPDQHAAAFAEWTFRRQSQVRLPVAREILAWEACAKDVVFRSFRATRAGELAIEINAAL